MSGRLLKVRLRQLHVHRHLIGGRLTRSSTHIKAVALVEMVVAPIELALHGVARVLVQLRCEASVLNLRSRRKMSLRRRVLHRRHLIWFYFSCGLVKLSEVIAG